MVVATLRVGAFSVVDVPVEPEADADPSGWYRRTTLCKRLDHGMHAVRIRTGGDGGWSGCQPDRERRGDAGLLRLSGTRVRGVPGRGPGFAVTDVHG